MKTLEELKAIKEQKLKEMNIRKEDGADNIRVVVGMATCGIAAGARPVLQMATEQVNRRNLQHVSITQTGCIGVCRLEPIVEVFVPGEEKVTYVKMTPERMEKVVAEHLVNKRVVAEYTIGQEQ